MTCHFEHPHPEVTFVPPEMFDQLAEQGPRAEVSE